MVVVLGAVVGFGCGLDVAEGTATLYVGFIVMLPVVGDVPVVPVPDVLDAEVEDFPLKNRK